MSLSTKCNLCDKTKEIETENVSGMGENRNVYSFSLVTPEIKKYGGVIIKMDLINKVGGHGLD